MNLPIRTLTPEDAEVLARTIVDRTATKGRIEYLGLQWRSDALLDWEMGEREAGRNPKVEVRIDELDLEFVYVDVPERGVGPFKAMSRQPNFTRGLSVFELNRLKKATKEKELDDRIGRLVDAEACQLRLEYYEQLGHADDPAARERMLQVIDLLAQKRLGAAEELLDEVPSTDPDEPPDIDKATPKSDVTSDQSTPGTSTTATPAQGATDSTTKEDKPCKTEANPPPPYSTMTVRRKYK